MEPRGLGFFDAENEGVLMGMMAVWGAFLSIDGCLSLPGGQFRVDEEPC
jgi:hypothetical protein